MVLFICCVGFCNVTWHQRPRQNLGHYLWIAKKGWFLKPPLKILDIPNQKYRYTATTQQHSASRITPLNAKDHVQWKWSISGHVKKTHRKYFCLNGTPGWKILRTTKAKTTPVDITRSKTVLFTREKFPLGTSPCNTTEHSERVCWNPKRWVRT